MSSNSATALATQQSIKAYVDTEIGNISQTSILQNNSNVTVADTGTGNVTIEVDGTDRITTVAQLLQQQQDTVLCLVPQAIVPLVVLNF